MNSVPPEVQTVCRLSRCLQAQTGGLGRVCELNRPKKEHLFWPVFILLVFPFQQRTFAFTRFNCSHSDLAVCATNLPDITRQSGLNIKTNKTSSTRRLKTPRRYPMTQHQAITFGRTPTAYCTPFPPPFASGTPFSPLPSVFSSDSPAVFKRKVQGWISPF